MNRKLTKKIIVLAFSVGHLTGITQNIVQDADGNSYNTVVIGSQEWISENLKTTTFCNGEPIETSLYSIYDNEESNLIYGRLYRRSVITDSRNVCPCEFHVPSEAEWVELIDYLGGPLVAGEKLKSPQLWNAPNTGTTNSSGFSAFPGGIKSHGFSGSEELFQLLGNEGWFWSTTSDQISNYTLMLYRSAAYAYMMFIGAIQQQSIRCVKNNSSISSNVLPCPGTPVVRDNSDYTYPTVQIGTQCWMRENLKTRTLNNGMVIPQANTDQEWGTSVGMGHWCYYRFSTDEMENYVNGKLYNYSCVASGSLCPAGWHVPTMEDVIVLTNYVGGDAGKLKSLGRWFLPNTGATNETGFRAVPLGSVSADCIFEGKNSYVSFWTSTPNAMNNYAITGPITAWVWRA